MRLVGVLVAAVVLVGCGGRAAGPDVPAPAGQDKIAVTQVVGNVSYYYACGNEVLTLRDGRTWYPVLDQEAVDPSRYEPTIGHSTDDQAMGARVVLAVVEPGPGDDTGSLTIYDDGMARWTSDSGTEAWLTDEVVEYEWEC